MHEPSDGSRAQSVEVKVEMAHDDVGAGQRRQGQRRKPEARPNGEAHLQRLLSVVAERTRHLPILLLANALSTLGTARFEAQLYLGAEAPDAQSLEPSSAAMMACRSSSVGTGFCKRGRFSKAVGNPGSV